MNVAVMYQIKLSYSENFVLSLIINYHVNIYIYKIANYCEYVFVCSYSYYLVLRMFIVEQR